MMVTLDHSLCIKLPQMIGYVKCFDSKVSNKKPLKKYNKIWERVSNFMSIEFASEPVFGDNNKYIKPKIKLYGDKVNINFYGDKVNKNFQGEKIPKENIYHILDSVIRANKKYYPQTLLEECKYEIPRNKMENLINDDLDLRSSDNESDNEVDNGSDDKIDD